VEESAAPKGGMAAFYKYVSEKMKYPAQARRMGTEGRVFVEFIVGKDGSISDVRAVRGIGGGCDEEAVRVLQSAPSWTPGKQRGKPVKQKMVIPIIFKLG
jgi:periplasmic protein TonB